MSFPSFFYINNKIFKWFFILIKDRNNLVIRKIIKMWVKRYFSIGIKVIEKWWKKTKKYIDKKSKLDIETLIQMKPSTQNWQIDILMLELWGKSYNNKYK